LDLMERDRDSLKRHPWELRRCDFFGRVLADAGLLHPGLDFLDAGAGDGFVARSWLAAHPELHSATCWDAAYSEEDLANYGAGGGDRIVFVREPPSGRFELVLLLDVLEHIEDDAAFLAEVVDERTAPGGRVLVSVPAWPWLFSDHDVYIQHYRRYHPAAARSLLRSAGLSIEREGGLFHGLLAARAAQKGIGALLPRNKNFGVGTWDHGPLLTRLVTSVLAADNFVSRTFAGSGLPGLSWWALCRREPSA
jgi:SAM-dependent methyltransferase